MTMESTEKLTNAMKIRKAELHRTDSRMDMTAEWR
jgi:hypothetical protein